MIASLAVTVSQDGRRPGNRSACRPSIGYKWIPLCAVNATWKLSHSIHNGARACCLWTGAIQTDDSGEDEVDASLRSTGRGYSAIMRRSPRTALHQVECRDARQTLWYGPRPETASSGTGSDAGPDQRSRWSPQRSACKGRRRQYGTNGRTMSLFDTANACVYVLYHSMGQIIRSVGVFLLFVHVLTCLQIDTLVYV